MMRKYLLEKMRETAFMIHETSVTEADVEKADEIFLTNAINGIRWVGRFRDKIYSNIESRKIYDRFIRTILW